ncbi:MAG: hypothetical protein LBS27_03600 [Bifidobacteriaceae bacterium]|nr:hypothetical protein [Bifidobacteriaceae bacterium]
MDFFRHTFATNTMVRSHRPGAPDTPERTLTVLSTWLGHANPARTYWYLQATPDLAAIAAARLDPARQEARP